MRSCDKPIRRLTGSLLALLLLAACEGTGNHTMIFGTNTLVALDVSSDPASGNPHFTLGYKRQEAVWLPLALSGALAEPTHHCVKIGENDKLTCVPGNDDVQGTYVCSPIDSRQANASVGTTPLLCTTIGDAQGALLQGSADGNGGGKDAYSVLASFGMKYDDEVEGDIAQYFATGLAARALAETGGASLVNKSEKSQATADAEIATAQARIAEAESGLAKRMIDAKKSAGDCVFAGGSYDREKMARILAQAEGIPETKKQAFLARDFADRAVFENYLSFTFQNNLTSVTDAVSKTEECK